MRDIAMHEDATGSLLRYLEDAAARFPDKIAFSDSCESLTFARLAELGRSVGAAIARHTRGAAGLPVAVMTRHRAADVAAFMGAHYAGCFYVPLDGDAPPEYRKSRLDVIDPVFTIDAGSVAELPQESPDADFPGRGHCGAAPADPAYAIFTSGSTGTPKAAVVSHASVINLIEWMSETFGFSERTVFAGQCPFYFDSSVQEIYSTLKNGCTTFLMPKKLFIFPQKALKYVQETGTNVLPWSAAAIKLVANSGAFGSFVPDCVEDVIFGGESMPAKILNIWRKAMPGTRFANVYGPSETTVDCACYPVDRDFTDGEDVPIGKACANTELLLLDESRLPVPDGEPGEIYVRGAGVGLGYWRDRDSTSAAFVPNPLEPASGEIVYRTGDIARRNGRGELVFLSRADSQVKHMGCRVELGEVEAAAAGLGGVDLACCAYDHDKGRILLAYEGAAAERELAAMLEDRLPRYMQPGSIIRMDALPCLPNGKIDRVRVREVCKGGL